MRDCTLGSSRMRRCSSGSAIREHPAPSRIMPQLLMDAVPVSFQSALQLGYNPKRQRGDALLQTVPTLTLGAKAKKGKSS
jgi:hypothetical protein